MRIIITRPKAEAERTAKAVEALGLQSWVEPMLVIYPLLAAANSLRELLRNPPQAVILTSGNAAKSLGKLTPMRDLPIIAVGAATARAASEVGFHRIMIAGGTAVLLGEMVLERCKPKEGPILYISSEHIAVNISGMLMEKGFTVHRLAIYKAEKVTAFSPAFIQMIESREPLTVLFFSERTAENFITLFSQYFPKEAAIHCRAVAISPAVGALLANLPWAGLRIAAHPTEAEVLANC